MFRTTSIILFLLIQTAAAAVAATCAGANPAITSVAVRGVSNDGKLNTYHIVGTVTNQGSAGQTNNTLQFVDIWQYGIKLDDKAIPPLAPGQSANFSYNWQRSTDAASGTTTLNFRIRMVQGSDCNPANGTYSVRI